MYATCCAVISGCAMQEAAKSLNVGLSVMKRVCRTLGLARWPYRTRASLQSVIEKTEKYLVCLAYISVHTCQTVQKSTSDCAEVNTKLCISQLKGTPITGFLVLGMQ